jgi:ABC-2 type transport system ATP-binding protein
MDGRQGSAIQVEGLTKVYAGGVEAVRGIHFEVAPGEVFSLLGPNGAGKSTTIGMLTATIAPTSGTARLAGFDVRREPLAARRISSVLFQDPTVDRPLSGRRNLEIHARLWGVDPGRLDARIDSVVETFDLAGLVDRPVGTYSGGERRRLEVARAVVAAPKVLFLDEPTVGLDPRVRRDLLDVIGRLRQEDDMAILLTTHYLDEAARLSDRIAIMHGGEIVTTGTPAQLTARLGGELVEARVAGDAGVALAALRGSGLANGDAFTIGSTLIVPALEAPAGAIEARIRSDGAAVISVVTRPPTLDDVYLSSTGGRIDLAA